MYCLSQIPGHLHLSLFLSLSTHTHTHTHSLVSERDTHSTQQALRVESSSSTAAWGKTHTHIHSLSHILLAKAKQMGRRDYCVEPYYLRRPNASISQILCLARSNSYCWYGASVLSYRYFSISSLPSQPSFIPVLVLSNSLTPASTFPGVSSTPLYPLPPHRPPLPLSSIQPLYTHAPNIYFAYAFLR